MKQLILVLVGVWALFQIAGLVSSPRGQLHGQSLAQLAEPPPHRLAEPYRNAYFYLLGFAASPSLDPAKVGYEMWVEAHDGSGGTAFDYDKPGRFDLHFPLSPSQALPSWEADDPLSLFRSKDASLRRSVDRHHLLLTRYDRCLGMPFEDWGFGHRATARHGDVMIAHRLYVADGLARSTNVGLDRLYKEMVFWRTVLREAATISTKVMAQIVIQDDVALLSRILSRPTVDKTLLAAVLPLTVPLTSSEYSLRWPIQHQLAVAGQEEHVRAVRQGGAMEATDQEQGWLAATAHLSPDVFQKIEHPPARFILGISLDSQRSADLYAVYYDALIKASGMAGGSWPRLREIAGTMRRGWMETALNPAPFEPEWHTFRYQLMETDARLRLISLQVHLRRPSASLSVPIRLAEVGSQYFDPFTNLPMLWSPTQQKLYSVGKDRLDDGGDPSFDITVPAVITTFQSSIPPSSSAIRKASRS